MKISVDLNRLPNNLVVTKRLRIFEELVNNAIVKSTKTKIMIVMLVILCSCVCAVNHNESVLFMHLYKKIYIYKWSTRNL